MNNDKNISPQINASMGFIPKFFKNESSFMSKMMHKNIVTRYKNMDASKE